MPAACRIVKTPDNIDEMASALKSSKVMNAVLRRFPQLGSIVRVINPAADFTKGSLARHVIARARLGEERQAAVTTALSLLSDKPMSKLFDTDELGFVSLPLKRTKKTVTTAQVHVNDLLEGSTANKFRLNKEQAAAVKLRKDIWDDLTFDYNRFSTRKLDREAGLFPRAVSGRLDETGKVVSKDAEVILASGGAKLKVTGGFTRARAKNKSGDLLTSAEMVKKGWRYRDPDVALMERAHEVGQATADAQFIKWASKQPYVRKKTQILGPGVETGVYPKAVPAEKFGGPVGMTVEAEPFSSSDIPGLAGYYAPKEVVDYISEIMKRPPRIDIPIATRVAEESRGFLASFDIGTTGIQLLGALGADIGHLAHAAVTLQPRRASLIFPTAVAKSIVAFFDKNVLDKYYMANKEVIDRWAPFIGGLHNAEYFENLRRAETGKLLKPLRVAEAPFARSFETSLDVAKIEYIKSLERSFGRPLTRPEQESLGAWVRNMTGTLSTKGLGIAPRQQSIESAFLFFSPRYTRSLFATVGTLLQGGVAGNEARLAIGGLMGGGLLTYYGVTQALGQPMNLDPKKPGFLSIRVGDNWVGIGGGVKAMSRLMASSFQAMKDNPKAFISNETRGTDANPLLSFWRSRTAPLTGVAIDIWKGEDFRGRPIDGVADWARVLAQRVIPFSLQAALESKGKLTTKTGIGLVAGTGLGTNPMSARQIYDSYLRDQVNAFGEPRFPDGTNTVATDANGFRDFVENDPMAEKLKQNWEDERLSGTKESQDLQRALNLRAGQLEAASDRLNQTGDYYTFRQQVNTIRASSRSALEGLHLDFVSSTDEKRTVSSWYKTYDDPRAIDPITGGIDSEGLEQAQDEWKAAHSGDYENLIEPNESYGETPEETDLRSDRKFIADSGWWDTTMQSWQHVQELTRDWKVTRGPSPNDFQTVDEWKLAMQQHFMKQSLDAGVPDETAFLLSSIRIRKEPLIKFFESYRTLQRNQLRRETPGLIVALDKWGYSTASLQQLQVVGAQMDDQGYQTDISAGLDLSRIGQRVSDLTSYARSG